MRQWLWSAGLLTVMGLGVGCAHNEAKQARSQGEKVGAAVADKVRFADQVSLVNQEQIAMGRLALEKSKNSEVRRFAQELIRDHERNEADLQALARNKAMSLAVLDLGWQQQGVGGAGYTGAEKGIEKGNPAYDEKLDKQVREFTQKRDKLAGLSGHEFDKSFLDQVRKGQKEGGKLVDKGLDKYRDDAALAAFLGRTAPVLNGHEQRAESLKGYLGE
jgi:putative membrane protein